MKSICPDCQAQMAGHCGPHAALSLISTLPNSQLYKCKECHAYLHRYDSEWEVLIEGYYNDILMPREPEVALLKQA